MIKNSIIMLVAVVVVVALAFAVYGFPNTQNTTNVSTNSDQPTNVLVTNTTNNTTVQKVVSMISASEAKKIASNYINQTGATAGTPQLVNQSGTEVYIVPVIYNGQIAGEIDIDAKTGKNLGGAGGV
jgi:uncharacterized membrane protein YkoI